MKKTPEVRPVAPDPSSDEITDLSEFEEILGDGDVPF